MIGPDSFLTSAHCAYSRTLGTYYQDLDVAPGRSSSGMGMPVSPYGKIEWIHVTIYSGYTEGEAMVKASMLRTCANV